MDPFRIIVAMPGVVKHVLAPDRPGRPGRRVARSATRLARYKSWMTVLSDRTRSLAGKSAIRPADPEPP